MSKGLLVTSAAMTTYSRQRAPGELERLETFCNSARFLYHEDVFAAPETASVWLRERGFVDRGLELASSELRRLVELRETIRDHLAAADPVGTASALNRVAKEVISGPEWTDAGMPRLRHRAEDPLAGLAANLLEILFTMELRGELARLKPCRAIDCQWLFYDRSPQGNSTWCSMQICGARHKMRTYRTRREA